MHPVTQPENKTSDAFSSLLAICDLAGRKNQVSAAGRPLELRIGQIARTMTFAGGANERAIEAHVRCSITCHSANLVTHRRPGAGRESRRDGGRAALVGHVPCDRCAAASRVRARYRPHHEFTIHDREDSADLMNLVRHDLGFSKTEKRFPMKGTCLSIYSRAVNAEAPLGEVLGALSLVRGMGNGAAELFAAYVEAKQKQNVLDYDDLLLYWAQMMVEGAVAQDIAARFDHVLVDEYQDTNRLQASILLALKPNGRGLTVVGDDAQSIYSFRAATVRNILDFPGHFSPKAEIITLERNYRSTQPILAAANAVIDLASERFTKNLWSDRVSAERPYLVNVADDTAQAGYIVEKILENREAGDRAQIPSRPVPGLASQRQSRSRTHAPKHPFREIRRAQVSGSGAHQGCVGGLALGAKHAGPRRRLSRGAAAAGHRAELGCAPSRSHGRRCRPDASLERIQASGGNRRALAGF